MVEKSSEEVVELREKFFGPGLGSEQERNSALDEIVESLVSTSLTVILEESRPACCWYLPSNANELFVFPVAASA